MARTEEPRKIISRKTCNRCAGTGTYGSIGVCFKCHGVGIYAKYAEMTTEELAANAAAVTAERDAADAAFAERQAARRAARAAGLPRPRFDS